MDIVQFRLKQNTAAMGQERTLHTWQRCLAEIESRYMQMKGRGDIADACHVAPEYICRLFKRFGNISPTYYLTKLRMKQAANRLQAPSVLSRLSSVFSPLLR